MNDVAMPLTCPKCGGQMRSYERNGVVVDQCADCRGIFLDRGELERLIDAEGAHYEREYSDRQPEDRGEKPRKRKRNFLEGLLEGGD